MWLHDITALRRIERVRRDFVANISHELRTPLTSIKLLAETLAPGTVEDAATMRDFAAQIEREADHLAQLVDELLDLSMIESGETTLALEPIDPEELVADDSSSASARWPSDARCTFAGCRLRHRDVAAHGGSSRLGQALLNLAHNAVKYSHHGGEVRVGWEPARRAGAIHRLRRRDRRPRGPPATHLRALLQGRPLASPRAGCRASSAGSAGLGLAIVRHIAEAHGGAVGLSSEEGVGLDVLDRGARAAT